MKYTLHNRIKSLREEAGISQKELAKIINVGNSTLSQYESGTRVPSDEIKIALASYFEVTLDYLMGVSNVRDPYKTIEDLKKEALKVGKDLEKLKELDEEVECLTDDDVIAAHSDEENVVLTEEDLLDIKEFLKKMRKKDE